jgi:carboxymethylenebutenolidase
MGDQERSRFTGRKAGEAYLVQPDEGPGPGVLVLCSWWGLTPWLKDFCGTLADHGYTVLAPDLLQGERPTSETEGEQALAALDADELTGLVISSAHLLRSAAMDASGPIGVVGFSMGASLAFWLSARLPDSVRGVVAFYGSQSIDFEAAKATYQGHYAEDDRWVSDDDRVLTESFVRLSGLDTEFHVYPGTRHWFMEQGSPNHDPGAAATALERTLDFLEAHLRDGSPPGRAAATRDGDRGSGRGDDGPAEAPPGDAGA